MRTSMAAVLFVATFASAGAAQAQHTAIPTVEHGTIRQTRPRARLGFDWQRQDQDRPVVSAVRENTSASKAGLAVGDSIIMVDGRSTLPNLRLFPDATPGRKYVVRVKRGAEERELTLEVMPPAAPARDSAPAAPGARP